MSAKNDFNQFKLADRQSDRRAKKTDIKSLLFAQKRYLYALYLAIDSGKLSLSTIKYLFDIYFANSDFATKAMQEWMRSPTGFATTSLSASVLIMITLIANSHDKQEKNDTKNYVVIFWPYARDSLKILRNTYRGILSTLTLIQLLDIGDLRHFIVPVSVLLGGVGILNRIWFRFTSSQRIKMMEANACLLAEIKGSKELNSAQIQQLSSKIAVQSSQLRVQLIISSVFSGTIDGLNPYIGTLTAGCLAPPMLTTITAFCALYFLTTLSIKIYEEIKLQCQLEELQKEIQSALIEKQIYVYYKPAENVAPTLFAGVKNGLTGYKYIMLAISTILFLSPIKIKSIEPIHRAILGITALLTGLLHAYIPSNKNRNMKDSDELKIVAQYSSQVINEEFKAVDPSITESAPATENSDRFIMQQKKIFNREEGGSSTNRNLFFANTKNEMDFCQPALAKTVICYKPQF